MVGNARYGVACLATGAKNLECAGCSMELLGFCNHDAHLHQRRRRYDRCFFCIGYYPYSRQLLFGDGRRGRVVAMAFFSWNGDRASVQRAAGPRSDRDPHRTLVIHFVAGGGQ